MFAINYYSISLSNNKKHLFDKEIYNEFNNILH